MIFRSIFLYCLKPFHIVIVNVLYSVQLDKLILYSHFASQSDAWFFIGNSFQLFATFYSKQTLVLVLFLTVNYLLYLCLPYSEKNIFIFIYLFKCYAVHHMFIKPLPWVCWTQSLKLFSNINKPSGALMDHFCLVQLMQKLYIAYLYKKVLISSLIKKNILRGKRKCSQQCRLTSPILSYYVYLIILINLWILATGFSIPYI